MNRQLHRFAKLLRYNNFNTTVQPLLYPIVQGSSLLGSEQIHLLKNWPGRFYVARNEKLSNPLPADSFRKCKIKNIPTKVCIYLGIYIFPFKLFPF